MGIFKRLIQSIKKTPELIDTEEKRIYDAAVRKALEDGEFTRDEKSELETLRIQLSLDTTTAEAIYQRNAKRVLVDFLDESMADQRITDEEQNQLDKICRSLGLELDSAGATRQKLNRYRMYWLIENEELPVIPSPMNLQRSENLHFMADEVEWLEQRKVTQRINYTSSTARIKIAKGVYYRMGSIKPKVVSRDEWQTIDTGSIYITNKRLIFMGLKGNKTIKFNKILDTTPHKNGIDIQKDTGKSPFIRFSDNVDLCSLILPRLISQN